MLWLPVLFLAPLAAMKLRTAMENACDCPDGYETHQEALDAIGMNPFVEKFCNSIGSIPVAGCPDCGRFHVYPYALRA